MNRCASILVSTALFVLAGCRAARPDTADLKIIGGLEAADGMFPNVVRITKKATGAPICTATAISKRAVLTAAHCVDGVGDPEQAAAATRDKQLAYGVAIQSVVYAESYDDEQLGVADLAIYVLAEDLAFDPALIDVRVVKGGQVVTIVGYGCATPDEKASTPKMKRYGTNLIRTVDATRGTLIYTRDEPGESDEPVLGENVATCRGDSGGPLFADGALVGVTSGVDDEFYLATALSSEAFAKLVRAANDVNAGILVP